jgi:protease II
MQDTRVPFWGTLKFIEKLRHLAKSPSYPDLWEKNIVLRLMNEEGTGHFGAVDNDENLESLIYEFAWLDFIMSA